MAILRFFAATCLWLMLAHNSAAYEKISEKFLTLDQAHITAYVDKAEESVREVKNFDSQALPWKWDDNIKRKGGVLHVEFNFSQKDFRFTRLFNAEPLAVYALNLGNRYRYALNDEPWTQVGWSNPTSNYRTHPQWFLLDTAYLRRNNVLRIQMIVEPNNSSGITSIQIGPAQDIRWHYQDVFDMQSTYTLVVASLGLLVGFMSLAMWISVKDRIYLLGFILELCFALRYLCMLWVEYPPIPTWAWNCLLKSLFSISSICTMLLGLWVANNQRPKLAKMAYILLWVLPGLLLVGALSNDHRFYTIVLALMILSCAFYTVVICVIYIKRPQTELLFFCIAAIGTQMLGIYDFVVIQIDPKGLGYLRLSPLGNFLFAITMGAIILTRYRRASRALFASKLEAKWQADLATKQERYRIMTDLHDTVGTQLTGLATLVRSNASKEILEEHTHMAIDDLRIAVNSLQAVDGKLEVALASFRRVIQPRLDAAGIRLVWQIQELPELVNFGSDKVMQLQKILQEAFANILKHSEATEVVFSAKPIPTSAASTLIDIQVEISDNGKGFDAAMKSGGIGLSNMQVRAQSIKANLKFISQPAMGTKVEMTFGDSSSTSE